MTTTIKTPNQVADMLGPILPRCSSWYHTGCQEKATGWLFAPDNEPVPGCYYCRQHATAIVEEYAEKLGESWTFVEANECRQIDAGADVSEKAGQS